MDNSKYFEYPFTVYTYDSVDSTNAVARRMVEMMGGAADMTVHVAGEQTAGRGRKDRVWLNTDDAVMMSIVQSTRLSMDRVPILNLVAAAAVRNALTKLTSHKVELAVKWPNDIIVLDRMEKVCGILSEAVSFGRDKYAIIGIGVNLNAKQMPSGLLQPATSIFLNYGRYINVFEAVKEILKEYDEQYRLMMSDTPAFLKAYAKDCISVGRHVSVDDGKSVRYGFGDRLATNGQLIVKYEDGATDLVYAADVSLRNQITIDERLVKKLLPKRPAKANKGSFGRAALIVGSDGMPGAALMSAKACVRSGAGLTKALIPPSLKASFAAVPEAMLVCDDDDADKLIEWADAILIGCGMGVNERTKALLKKALLSKKPCVIDADALNTLSLNPDMFKLLQENAVLTPHPAEMSRLTGKRTEDIVRDMTVTAREASAKWGCTVLLKSSVSVIASPDQPLRYNDCGNTGLAKGGSGDVLSGLVTGMLAQGSSPYDAASIGAFLLGSSAEKALDLLHTRFITASDITEIIGSELNYKEDKHADS